MLNKSFQMDSKWTTCSRLFFGKIEDNPLLQQMLYFSDEMSIDKLLSWNIGDLKKNLSDGSFIFYELSIWVSIRIVITIRASFLIKQKWQVKQVQCKFTIAFLFVEFGNAVLIINGQLWFRICHWAWRWAHSPVDIWSKRKN
jgi:hypothetical protein